MRAGLFSANSKLSLRSRLIDGGNGFRTSIPRLRRGQLKKQEAVRRRTHNISPSREQPSNDEGDRIAQPTGCERADAIAKLIVVCNQLPCLVLHAAGKLTTPHDLGYGSNNAATFVLDGSGQTRTRSCYSLRRISCRLPVCEVTQDVLSAPI